MTAKFPSHLKKYVFASLVGNGLEWYDFAIFGYFSPVLSKLFFPSSSPFISLINIFAVFAVGFLSRPLGAYIFGKIGDQQGRKQAFLYSMLLMAFSTSLMGLLPTYDSIGILAPLLLVLLRVFQGVSLGGEFTGSLSFVIEHSPTSRKGMLGALTYSGGFLGSVFGASIGTLVTFWIPPQQLFAWGWRIPFLFGFVIAFMGYYLRRKVEETPAFLELKEQRQLK
jgi:MHS family proline/betaine transporter-like MFS transporter